MKRSNKILVAALLLSSIFLLAIGCEKHTKYKVMTVFFTGVPHPDDKVQAMFSADDKPLSIGERAQIRRMQKNIEIKIVTHGPYGAKQCYQCHDTESTASLYDKSSKPTSMPQWTGRMPGRLSAPLKELCPQCHITKSAESAFSRDLWIHGPVSDGLCTICHNPHQTQYPALLVKESATDLCKDCHGEGFLMKTEAHLKDEECTSCHNAHLGKNRFLLKEDYEEIY